MAMDSRPGSLMAMFTEVPSKALKEILSKFSSSGTVASADSI